MVKSKSSDKTSRSVSAMDVDHTASKSKSSNQHSSSSSSPSVSTKKSKSRGRDREEGEEEEDENDKSRSTKYLSTMKIISNGRTPPVLATAEQQADMQKKKLQTKNRKEKERKNAFDPSKKLEVKADVLYDSKIFNKTQFKTLVKAIAATHNQGVVPIISEKFMMVLYSVVMESLLITNVLPDAANRRLDFLDYTEKGKGKETSARINVRLIGRCTRRAFIHHFSLIDAHSPSDAAYLFTSLHDKFVKRFNSDKNKRNQVTSGRSIMKVLCPLLDATQKEAMKEEIAIIKNKEFERTDKNSKALHLLVNGSKGTPGVKSILSEIRHYMDDVNEYNEMRFNLTGKTKEKIEPPKSKRWTNLSFVFRFFDAICKKASLLVYRHFIEGRRVKVSDAQIQLEKLNRTEEDEDAPKDPEELSKWLIGSIRSSVLKSQDKEKKKEEREKSKGTAARREEEKEELQQRIADLAKQIKTHVKGEKDEINEYNRANESLALHVRRWESIDNGVKKIEKDTAPLLKDKKRKHQESEETESEAGESEEEEQDEKPKNKKPRQEKQSESSSSSSSSSNKKSTTSKKSK